MLRSSCEVLPLPRTLACRGRKTLATREVLPNFDGRYIDLSHLPTPIAYRAIRARAPRCNSASSPHRLTIEEGLLPDLKGKQRPETQGVILGTGVIGSRKTLHLGRIKEATMTYHLR